MKDTVTIEAQPDTFNYLVDVLDILARDLRSNYEGLWAARNNRISKDLEGVRGQLIDKLYLGLPPV